MTCKRGAALVKRINRIGKLRDYGFFHTRRRQLDSKDHPASNHEFIEWYSLQKGNTTEERIECKNTISLHYPLHKN